MGVLDFLFEGKPPAAVTTYGQTVENLPKWMSDYTQGLIARANAIAAEPYQPYQGPRIASFTPDQQAAFDATRGAAGAYRPGLGEAERLTRAAGATSPLAIASPYLARAGQTFPENVETYMNPYIQNVLNRQESLAQRTLTEKFLPELQDAFTSAGQFGSERMLEMGLRGTRDIQENLEEQRLATLANAYGQAADIFGADASRMGQLAATAGDLGTAGAEIGLTAGRQMGALGEAAQQLGLRGAAGLEAIGSAQQGQTQRNLDLAYRDFLEQREYPRETADWMSAIIRGMPYSRATQVTDVGPSAVYQPSPLAQIASAVGTVKGLQNLGQARGGLARARSAHV